MGFLSRLLGFEDEAPLIISQYSDMPRYYVINGIKYDIDNPKQIEKIPLFKKTFFINNIEYGMDSILMEHGRQAYSKNIAVHQAAIEKANQFRYSGFVFKTEREKEEEKKLKERWKQLEIEKEKRAKQCNTFKIKDMHQFSDIPFEWNFVQELMHTNGIAWFMLNMNNQYIALQYIDLVDKLIIELHKEIPQIRNCEIFSNEIDFNYPIPAYPDSLPNTYVECLPYTKTGKISKYPAVLHFSTSETEKCGTYIYQRHPIKGDICILKDGNIGSATVNFGHMVFKIGLHGINLIVKRIDNNGVNIYKFE